MKNYTKLEIDIINHAIEMLPQYIENDVQNLHHHMFNEDYWVNGRYEAEQEILKHCNVFDAIQLIIDWEYDHLGQMTSKINEAENVCYMLVYILSIDILNSCESYFKNLDSVLTKEISNNIITELKNLLNYEN
jgi:hypothetical protein